MAAAALLALATIAGALEAHTLPQRLSIQELSVMSTAVQYQFYNSLGLLALGVLIDRWPLRGLLLAGWLLLAGVVLFSGSLYGLVAGAPALLGVLTPIGGVSLIAGWGSLALALFALPRSPGPPAER